jgi:hypothetical protein
VFSGFLVFSDFAYYRVASRGLRSVLVCYPLNEIRARLSAVTKKKNPSRSCAFAIPVFDAGTVFPVCSPPPKSSPVGDLLPVRTMQVLGSIVYSASCLLTLLATAQ